MDRLKLLRDKLPLDGKYSEVWLGVNKLIDPLHLKNHKVLSIMISIKLQLFNSAFKRPECKQLYNPEALAVKFPEANWMVCEQVFCWLGRFKKILNSMPKTHHHFILHKLIKRRNDYTAFCQRVGKYPLLPSAREQK